MRLANPAEALKRRNIMAWKTIVDDGESLIIGGLLQKKRHSQTSGIPYFQDIPIVGGMFSNKVERLVDSEILIMIRPRIIRG